MKIGLVAIVICSPILKNTATPVLSANTGHGRPSGKPVAVPTL
jgi:hypothetical protein